MEAEVIQSIVEKQRQYFLKGETYSIKFRLEMLKKLQKAKRF